MSIDAPVSGGDIGAQQGKLVIFCGGREEGVTKIKPLLQCYGRSIQYFGGAGKGQHCKMANQIVLANNLSGMAEGLLYASKMGLNIDTVIEAIEVGGASSTALSVMGRRVAKGDYEPGFYIEHFIKDMEIALSEAERANLSLPCFSLIKQLYTSLKTQGK